MWPRVLCWHSWLRAGKEVKKIPLASFELLPLCVVMWLG